ncbi:MBL fold metallo-hydrolase [Streptomyces mobaraensis]|uniref:MBL fold metallo-hydrolase n=1 Tax=Streptomyces mobaraensis TaxID=35621 RepID=A0A5N5VY53_STRMB|nr:MBL fold metallo-hydrolase [Streptomyces mobaraensis]KAB7833785.1 MBL fold metallo-hydrolase [Streptomyces mobaraensis]
MLRPDPAPEPSPQPAAPTSWQVGDVRVHRVDEIALPPETGAWLLPAATRDVVSEVPWLRPDFTTADHAPRLASHTFAFEAGGKRVLVDTGIGNGKTRANPAWHQLDTGYLRRLTAAGFPPESVDLVVLTHLHTDHVGWNTRRAEDGSWVPTFPNARYVTSRTEWDHWAGQAATMEESRRQMFRDSVDPIRDAGLLDLVDVHDGPAPLAPGLRLLPTPGHTPGHIAVELRAAGGAAVITGDCVHHPVQLAHPGITSCVDTDPAQAVRTRRGLLASLAGAETLLLGTHFPPPTAGRVTAEGDGFRLVPAS